MIQGLNYTPYGDYDVPDSCLPEETDLLVSRDLCNGTISRRIILFDLTSFVSDALWTYLADLSEQAKRLGLIIKRQEAAEGATENMEQHDQMAWAGAMNSTNEILEKSSLKMKDITTVVNCMGCLNN